MRRASSCDDMRTLGLLVYVLSASCICFSRAFFMIGLPSVHATCQPYKPLLARIDKLKRIVVVVEAVELT